MEITVKHEFTMSPELEAFFSRVMAPMLAEPTAAPAKTKREVKAAEPIAVVEETLKEEVKPTATTTTDITVEQLRAVVSEKANAGKRTEIKQLLTAFGAENVTSLDKSLYAEFLTKVTAI